MNMSSQNEAISEIQPNQPIRTIPTNVLRIKADITSYKCVCIFLIFTIIVGLSMVQLSAKLFAHPLITKTAHQQLNGTSLQKCYDPLMLTDQNILKCSRYQLSNVTALLPNYTTLNQYLYVQFDIRVVQPNIKTESFNLTMNLTIYEIAPYLDNFNKGPIEYKAVGSQVIKINSTFIFTQRNLLHYEGGEMYGYRFPVYFTKKLESKSYFLLFDMDTAYYLHPNIMRISATVTTVDPRFLQSLIKYNYVMTSLALLAFIFYFYKYRKIPQKLRTFQQKLILSLSILLIMFTDPQFSFTVYYPNFISTLFTLFFNYNVSIFLLFLWAMFLERMLYGEQNQNQTNIFTTQRKICLFFAQISLLSTCISVIYFNDSTELRSWFDQDPFNAVVKIFLLAVMFLGLIVIVLCHVIYILILCCRLFTKRHTMFRRNIIFLLYSIPFILFSIICKSYLLKMSLSDYSELEIIFSTIIFLYSIYLQYMYTPIQMRLHKSRFRLNDSNKFQSNKMLQQKSQDLSPNSNIQEMRQQNLEQYYHSNVKENQIQQNLDKN